MSALLVGGAVVAARFASILTFNPVGARALDHVIVYDTDWEFGYVTAAGYVLVTCGPALLASSRLLRWFGVANLAGLLLASGVRYSAVTSGRFPDQRPQTGGGRRGEPAARPA